MSHFISTLEKLHELDAHIERLENRWANLPSLQRAPGNRDRYGMEIALCEAKRMALECDLHSEFSGSFDLAGIAC